MFKNIFLTLILPVSLWAVALQASGMHIGHAKIQDQSYEIDIEVITGKSSARPELLNKMLRLKVVGKGAAKEDRKVELIEFDARMPEHNHGMIVKPKISRTGTGEWKIEGVKLHMKGFWELSYKLKIDDAEQVLMTKLMLD